MISTTSWFPFISGDKSKYFRSLCFFFFFWHLYSLLRTCKVWQGTVEQLHHALGDKAPTYLQMLVALQLWQESGLVRWYDRGERMQIEILPTEGKVDLTETPLYQYIQKGDANDVE